MKIIPDSILQKVIKLSPDNIHKETFGKVLVVADNLNMGTAIMAGSAAVYAGAGLVTLLRLKIMQQRSIVKFQK